MVLQIMVIIVSKSLSQVRHRFSSWMAGFEALYPLVFFPRELCTALVSAEVNFVYLVVVWFCKSIYFFFQCRISLWLGIISFCCNTFHSTRLFLGFYLE